MKKIELIHKKPSELKHDFENPRKISKEALKDLQKSIETLGDFGVVVVDDKLNVISGNQRVKAMLEAGIDIPIVCKQLIGYSSKEKKAINVKANISSGDWDYEQLDGWSEDLNTFDFIDKEFNIEKIKEVDGEDNVPEVKETTVKRGDIYQLGVHRLMCGDSTNEENVNALLDDSKIDMVFTDPPYGINIVRNNSIGGSKPFGKNGFDSVIKAGNYKVIKGDNSTDTANKSINICLSLKTLCIFWGGNYYADFLPITSCWIIWDKETDGKFGDGEIAWCNAKKSIRIFRHKWSGMIKASEKKDKRIHPTQKPIALAEWAFLEFKPKKNILDLFLGSGSTLIACEKTNRICYGMELDEYYCQVIIDRYKQFTGKDDVKLIRNIYA